MGLKPRPEIEQRVQEVLDLARQIELCEIQYEKLQDKLAALLRMDEEGGPVQMQVEAPLPLRAVSTAPPTPTPAPTLKPSAYKFECPYNGCKFTSDDEAELTEHISGCAPVGDFDE